MGRATQIVATETVIIAVAVGVLTTLGIYWYQRKRKLAMPTVWEPVAKVKQLYIYPLKSGHRIELKNAICTPHGIKMPKAGNIFQFHDRNMLVYREDNNNFVSARQHPHMIFIQASPFDENHFLLSAPTTSTLKVKIPTSSTTEPHQIIQHKGEKIYTVDCGEEAAKWVSNYIINEDKGLRLGFYDGLRRRDISKSHARYFKFYERLRSEATGMYTDLSSFLLLNQASVDELNNRLRDINDVTVNNFRPNIVVESKNLAAYAEDEWQWVKIGDVVLYAARPCTRCVFTTIDPENGIKSKMNEPLTTMKTYRMLKDVKNIEIDGELPVMGINMGLLKSGEIQIGDTVYVGKN